MPPSVPLSKTKLLDFCQCPRKLWLGQYSPELEEELPELESRIATGEAVGDLARRVYGKDGGHRISNRRGLRAAIAETAELVAAGGHEPIFEATFEGDGVTVQVDVLERSGPAPRVVEVKAAASVKAHHLTDCAVQSYALTEAGHAPASVAVAHIDTAFVYAGDGRYDGLFKEVEVTEEIADEVSAMRGIVAAARETFESLDEPEVEIGPHCLRPYPCPFFEHCESQQAPNDAAAGEHDELARAEPELARFAAELDFPRYYLDFETISFAVPIWAGTRPYEPLLFQWSCHIERAPGELEHEEYLDIDGGAPMRACTEALLETLGESGPVLVYTPYEKRIIEALIARFPDLEPALTRVLERLVDLHPVTKQHYYHPDMEGSWSLKAVLPTVAPNLDYDALDEVQDGEAAQSAYLEAIAADTSAARRQALRTALLAYCRLDTLALVRLVEFFARA